jgi:peptide deformylase
MIRTIPQIGDPVLRAPNLEVSTDAVDSSEIQALIDDMIDTMRHAHGAGIAANQVGINLRICVIGVEANERYPYKPALPLTVLVNPVVEQIGTETFLNNEGCLSVPIRGDLARMMAIKVRAWDRTGRPFEQIYRGLSAGTVQHEVDHLDGKLILDRVTDPTSFSTWENFKAHEYDRFVERIQPVIAATEPRTEPA